MGNELVMGHYHFLIKRKIMRTEDNKGKKNPITLKLLHKSELSTTKSDNKDHPTVKMDKCDP